MTRTLLISLLAVTVLTLALGGWTVRALRWTLSAGASSRALPAT
jgi:hypothetical protein